MKARIYNFIRDDGYFVFLLAAGIAGLLRQSRGFDFWNFYLGFACCLVFLRIAQPLLKFYIERRMRRQ